MLPAQQKQDINNITKLLVVEECFRKKQGLNKKEKEKNKPYYHQLIYAEGK